MFTLRQCCRWAPPKANALAFAGSRSPPMVAVSTTMLTRSFATSPQTAPPLSTSYTHNNTALSVEEFDHLLQATSPIIVDYLRGCKDETRRRQNVVKYMAPEKLEQVYDWSLPQQGGGNEAVVSAVQAALEHSVAVCHPRFYNQLYAGPDLVGVLGELVTAVLNTNVHTYSVAPVGAVLEKLIIKELCSMVGWDTDHDGVFVPGGTNGNETALVVARNVMLPQCRAHGMRALAPGFQTSSVDDACTALVESPEAFGAPSSSARVATPMILTSNESHYSIQRSAMVCGLGNESSVVKVETDNDGRMKPQALARELERLRGQPDFVPFFVNATAGTTVPGSFDPLRDIAAVCREHNVWMHVDASWGGSVLFSDQHRQRVMDGVELADSLVWCGHKGLGVPINSTFLLTRHPRVLQASNSSAAGYLFHKLEAAYDPGDKTLQCGRRMDMLKVWLSWKGHGKVGFRNRVDHAIHLAQVFGRLVATHDDEFDVHKVGSFSLVQQPSYANVCFNYIPPHLLSWPRDERFYRELDALMPRMRTLMRERGQVLLNYQPSKSRRHGYFWRLVLNSPDANEDDMRAVRDEFHVIGPAMAPN